MPSPDEYPDFLWLDDHQAATRSPAVVRDVSESTGRTPGEAGLWIFIFGDMTLFGAILLVFLWERRSDRDGFADAAAQLVKPIGAANTLVLLLSSYLVVAAVVAHREGRLLTARRLIQGAVSCAALFATCKAVEYAVEISAGHTPSTGTFFTFYYVLTGLHLLHVLVGSVLLSAWMTSLRRQRPWPTAGRFAEGVAVYWHMVDLLWIAIFTLVYLVCAE